MNFINQKTNKQTKDAKLHANIRQELEGEKGSRTFFRVLERQNMQIQIILELYTDDSKSIYSEDILQPAKKYMKNSTPSKLPQLNF